MLRFQFISVLVQIRDHCPPVGKGQADAFVQICEFTKTSCQSVVFIHCSRLEYFRIRVECHNCPGILSLTYDCDRLEWLSFLIFLNEDLALTVDFSLKIV